MMTLEEAIKHCKDVALSCTNKECALEHFQLLKWLQEYSNMLEKQCEQRSDIGISSTTKQKLKDNLNKALQKETCDSWNEFLDEQNPMTGSKFKVGDKVVHKGTGKTWTVHWYIKEDNTYSVEDSEGLINIYSPDVLEPIEQKSAEWSEEDNAMLISIENILIGRGHSFHDKEINWLKSLKNRYTWKPSDEQIKVCKEVYADILSAKGFDLGTVNSELNRLEEELKKLREE